MLHVSVGEIQIVIFQILAAKTGAQAAGQLECSSNLVSIESCRLLVPFDSGAKRC